MEVVVAVLYKFIFVSDCLPPLLYAKLLTSDKPKITSLYIGDE